PARSAFVPPAGFRPGPEAGKHRPTLRRILHNEVRRHGHGIVDLSCDRRGAWRTDVGDGERAAGRRVSVQPLLPERNVAISDWPTATASHSSAAINGDFIFGRRRA